MRWRRGTQHLHGRVESYHGVSPVDENSGGAFAENRDASVGHVEQRHQAQQLIAVVGLCAQVVWEVCELPGGALHHRLSVYHEFFQLVGRPVKP